MAELPLGGGDGLLREIDQRKFMMANKTLNPSCR